MENLYLVTLEASFADEFVINGFSILSEEQINEMVALLDKTPKNAKFFFGTNEYVEKIDILFNKRLLTQMEVHAMRDIFPPDADYGVYTPLQLFRDLKGGIR